MNGRHRSAVMTLWVIVGMTSACRGEKSEQADTPPPDTSHAAPAPAVVARTDTAGARAVLAEIARDGSMAVGHHLAQDDSLDARVMRGIESGDSLWLLVADRFDSIGNVSLAESLPIYLATALANAPERVLVMTRQPRYAAKFVCTMPYIEPESSFVAEYYKKTKAALVGVTRPDLIPDRDRCLALLEKANKP